MNPNELVKIFVQVFGPGEKVIIGSAPGRVNLIGEHTDYNDGFVFPMAIDFRINVAARRRQDQLVKIFSPDFQNTVEFSLSTPIEYDSVNKWSNYPRGVMAMLQKAGIQLSGMELAVSGNVPQGAGLSSSAALEVATAVTLQKLLGFELVLPQLAKLCQKAENTFVGMNCGIMDQFISMMGQKDHALFLDCRSLEYQQVPLDLGDCRIVICHSGVKHSLVDSEYNKRRQECETGVTVLSRHFPAIKALRDVTIKQLNIYADELDPVVFKRCQHVITENDRVLQSMEALKKGDLAKFGLLMNQSHDSLRDDYEVSCGEIDLLVKLAREVPGVLGSRITGGGFGGCTVNLVKEASLKPFNEYVLSHYQKETGIEPRCFISLAASGAHIVNLGGN